MLIVCPSCASEYEVDSARIGAAGRRVRCAKCRTAWLVEPCETPDADAAGQQGLTQLTTITAADERAGPVVDSAQAVVPAHPRRRGPRGRSRPLVPGHKAARLSAKAAAALLALAVVLAAPAAVALRTKVVRLAPGTAGLFAAMGLPVNLVGLNLAGVASGLLEEKTGRALLVEGEITHAAKGKVKVPRLEFAIEGASGEILYRWSSPPPVAEMTAGETARFQARLPSPPPDGRRVLVSFRSGREREVASR